MILMFPGVAVQCVIAIPSSDWPAIARHRPFHWLIRCIPDLTLDEVAGLCGRDVRRRRYRCRILAAVDTQGYLHGLVRLPDRTRPVRRPVLSIENFIAADVCGRDDAGRDLIEVINRLADDKQCGAIRVSVAQDVPAMVVNPTPTFARFSRDGLAADAVRLKKQIARA